MLGRQVGSSLLRLPLSAHLPIRSHPLRNATSRVIVCTSLRHYATPGRPRKAVGEPSKPVKRAVKRDARKPTSKSEAAKEKVDAKKAAAAKKKPVAKAKKAVKKVLSEQQKETLKIQTEKNKIKDLKAAALSPPRTGSKISAYNIYIAEKMSGQKFSTPAAFKSTFTSALSDYKQLAPAELEHYNHLAVSATTTQRAEYKRWVESHTPEQIHRANLARSRLRKLEPKGSHKFVVIKDERHVKKPLSPYLQFSVNRQATGDFRNIPMGERAKLIAAEWWSLGEGEKKKYQDLSTQDGRRYVSEYEDTYGHPPQQAAAAASA